MPAWHTENISEEVLSEALPQWNLFFIEWCIESAAQDIN